MESSIYWIGMIGIVAFTISAVLTVVPKGTNLWSASVFGLITAIGGGTIRDVILDVPVFWAVDLNYIWVSLGASLAVFISQNFFTRKHIYSSILYLDGIGVAGLKNSGSNDSGESKIRKGTGRMHVIQSDFFRPLPRTRVRETRDREQAFGYKAEDEYENDDEDDSTRSGTPETKSFGTWNLEFEKLLFIR